MSRTTLSRRDKNGSQLSSALHLLSGHRLVYGILGLLILGVALGSLTVRYGSAELMDELHNLLASYILNRADQMFLPAFLSSFTVNFLLVFLLFVLGFCAVAPPVILLAAVARGFSIGVSIGYLYGCSGFSGILYAIQNLLPVSLIDSFTMVLVCASSYKMSSIYFSLFTHSLPENSIQDASGTYLTKFIVYTILIFIAALLDGICCSLFGALHV